MAINLDACCTMTMLLAAFFLSSEYVQYFNMYSIILVALKVGKSISTTLRQYNEQFVSVLQHGHSFHFGHKPIQALIKSLEVLQNAD